MGDAENVEEEAVPLSVGERLRQAREAAGLSLEDIATTTRIPTRHLESLEASDFDRLPAPTYTIGFAKNYAAAVGLDRAEIGEQLRSEMGGTRPATTSYDAFEPADPARVMPKWLILVVPLAIIAAILFFSWLNNRSLEVQDETAALNEAAPAPQPTAPPVQQAQGPVVITANDRAWIEVKDGNVILRQGELALGQSFEVPANAVAPTLTTAKPEALRISVGTADAPPIGEAGTRVTVSLKPEDLMRPQPAAAASEPAAVPPAATPNRTPPPRRAVPPPAQPNTATNAEAEEPAPPAQ